jgi:hypothetical protein
LIVYFLTYFQTLKIEASKFWALSEIHDVTTQNTIFFEIFSDQPNNYQYFMELSSQYILPHRQLHPYSAQDRKYYPEVLHDVLQVH